MVSKISKNKELSLKDMDRILGTTLNIRVIPTSDYTVFVDLSENGGLAYILCKTGKKRDFREIYRLLKVVKWDEFIKMLITADG